MLGLAWAMPLALGALPEPVITAVSMNGSELIVTVDVAPGIKVITLESRTRAHSGSWVPLSVKHLDGAGGLVHFQIPLSAAIEILRARADDRDRLPGQFFSGRRSFGSRAQAVYPQPNSPPVVIIAPPSEAPVAPVSGDGTLILTGPPSGGVVQVTPRSVVESDIWKLDGNTLYFYNQVRGLQVIDLSDPAAPRVKGSLSLPGSGEEMYLLGGSTVVLLTQKQCTQDLQITNSLVVVDVSSDVRRTAELPIPGAIQDSRLIGTALYVASQAFRPSTNNGTITWESGTVISAADLADPAHPVMRDELWIAGSGNVVYATDRFFFVALQNSTAQGQTAIQIIDVSSPDGVMVERGQISTAGAVTDKFKMHLSGERFFVVSLKRDWPIRTFLQAFDLSNPEEPVGLGSLAFAENEQLYATRFSDNRAYVVTYRRTDPLWIIDLSDPQNLRIAGELQVPGWSTYIYPWGDRLITMGIDDVNGNRVAVSLFSVSNPAAPALLSKVSLGEYHSWSEATANEKAFGVFPEQGLLLVPYGTGNQLNRVQIIDLTADTLTARGVIQHDVPPRRATLHESRILAISSQALLVIDAANRSQPQLLSSLQLSWPADRVLVHGDQLLQIQSAWPPTIRVTSKEAPDQVLATIADSNDWSVVGAEISGAALYLALAAQPNVSPEMTNRFRLAIYDLSAPLRVQLLGSISAPSAYVTRAKAFWPASNILVWETWSGYGGLYPTPVPPTIPLIPLPGIPIDIGAPMPQVGPPVVVVAPPSEEPLAPVSGMANSFASAIFIGEPNWYRPIELALPRARYVSFDVSDPALPSLLATLAANHPSASADSTFLSGSLLFTSHKEVETRIISTNSYTYRDYFTEVETNIISHLNILSVPNEPFITNKVDLRIEIVPTKTVLTTTNVFIVTNAYYLRKHRWLPPGESVTGITLSSGRHTLARKLDGTVWAMGLNPFGQLGDSSVQDRFILGLVPGLPDVQQVAAGGNHSLALGREGQLWSWGANHVGQLGRPLVLISQSPPFPQIAYPVPVLVPDLPSLSAVAAGLSHSLALTSDGTVWSWGANSRGQLGDGSTLSRHTPQPISGLPPVARISAGITFSLALSREEGGLWSWGDDEYGQLGFPSRGSQSRPEQAPNLSGLLEIYAGRWHAAALHQDGSLLTWGRNHRGQLGDGTALDRSNPKPVAGLEGVIDVALGDTHSLALHENGTVSAWGDNTFGQLGDRSPHHLLPVPFAEIDDAVAIAASVNRSLILRDSGELWVWGDATPAPDATVEVIGFTNMVAITNVSSQTISGFATNFSFVTNEIVVTTYERVTNIVYETNYFTRFRSVLRTNYYPVYAYIDRYQLDVADFSNATEPVWRRATPIPGALMGIAYDGAVLLTKGPYWDEDDQQTDGYWVTASAYDGAAAYLMDALPVSSPSLLESVNGSVVFGTNDATGTSLTAWAVSPDTGKFTQSLSLELNVRAHTLQPVSSVLMGLGNNQVQVIDLSNWSAPRIGPVVPTPCLAFDWAGAALGAPGKVWVPANAFGVWSVNLE